MRKYPCKKEVSEQLLESKMKDIFGKVSKNGNRLISSNSESLEVTVEITGKKEISVETKTSPGKDQEAVIKTYNQFLEEITGYNAKERKKLMSKI
ncbi:MAG: DUF5611 family protein [Thermoplasmatales archaeon]|jgi:hypothetical protein|nr:DUF5611 family protein [Candidatus Thermoplasmatota archaeon]MCL6002160.1 DUF5611 family protein [Candidatus Thermoplasmatota archaeon]MDA8055964.1 DUF5611 family protein [Thermoplasmatales archaeon]